jgi:FkbM family methyltransferase
MKKNTAINLGSIIKALPEIKAYHARTASIYNLIAGVAKHTVDSTQLVSQEPLPIDFGDIGELFFPYTSMGAINSLDLFGLDELIIFSYYWVNRLRYKRVADIGANIGLHSILMSRCGWQVSAYEPDPIHTNLIARNLKLNNIEDLNLVEAAVSSKEGELEFIRVLGNTTGSHLAGAKKDPYGELEKFTVRVKPISEIMSVTDFIKMDVEGQEAEILCSTTKKDWNGTDMILEVGTSENASKIYDHLVSINVNAFSQKKGWNQVTKASDMPESYKEGSLFISKLNKMPWD